jgi:uncharacterized protein (TIGR02284 family)
MEKASVVLNDLIKINDERVVCYRHVIDCIASIDMDLIYLFKGIIIEGQSFKQQLIKKINPSDCNLKDNVNVSGLIYRIWLDLKITFTGSTRNAIINFCEYNEEVAQQTYKVALNVSTEMNIDICTLLEEQHTLLKCNFISIKKCRGHRANPIPMLAYFN